MHAGGQVDRLRQTDRPVAFGAGCDNFMEGCQSMRSRDSANRSERRGLHFNEFAKEVEQIKQHTGLFGPVRQSKAGTEALAKCRAEREARAAQSPRSQNNSILSYQDLPIQISDMRRLAEDWNSQKTMLVILTGCSSEVQHSVGPMTCLVANPFFEQRMYMPSSKLVHKSVSKLFGPATHEGHKITLSTALQESREMPSTYMLLYGGTDPMQMDTSNASTGPAKHRRIVVSTNVKTFYLRDSWNRPNAFAVLSMDYLGKAKIETVEYWTTRNEFADVCDASLDTHKRQLLAKVDKDFNIASRFIGKTIRRGEERKTATFSDDPYTSEMGQISARMKGVSEGSKINFDSRSRNGFHQELSRTAVAGLDEDGVLRGATLETFGNREDNASEDVYARQQFRKASDARQRNELVEGQLKLEDQSYYAHPKFGLKPAAR